MFIFVSELTSHSRVTHDFCTGVRAVSTVTVILPSRPVENWNSLAEDEKWSSPVEIGK